MVIQKKLNKKNLRIKVKNKCTKMEKRERGVVHNINRETSYRMSFHPMSLKIKV
jgi:hypothetical protein